MQQPQLQPQLQPQSQSQSQSQPQPQPQQTQQPPPGGIPGGIPSDASPGDQRSHLYVGNLNPKVNDAALVEIFSTAGPVISVKIIPDRNFQHGGLNYGFVEYADPRVAETAIQTLNGRKVYDTEIKVNWAFQGQHNPQQSPSAGKEDTTNHAHIFVGDLSAEVSDEALATAFSSFGSISDARVMWDMNSGKSRGFGFVAFRDKKDAEQAIATMNGEWLGSRAIRCNWANQKGSGSGGLGGGHGHQQQLTYESVVTQTPPYNSTVYVGNLVPYIQQADLIPLFQPFGYIVEIRIQGDRGFAFIKLDTHENAAMAIVSCNGFVMHGRPLKCSWGKDRVPFGMQEMHAGYGAPAAAGGLYGMPTGAYGYGGYGFAGSPGEGTGSPQPGGPVGVGLGGPMGPAGWDPNQPQVAVHGGGQGQGHGYGHGHGHGHSHGGSGHGHPMQSAAGWPYEYASAPGFYGGQFAYGQSGQQPGQPGQPGQLGGQQSPQ